LLARRQRGLPNLDVAIAATGLAGLACGRELCQHAVAVTRHDAEPRAGGRVELPFPKGAVRAHDAVALAVPFSVLRSRVGPRPSVCRRGGWKPSEI
jgi:monoamine oxidase